MTRRLYVATIALMLGLAVFVVAHATRPDHTGAPDVTNSMSFGLLGNSGNGNGNNKTTTTTVAPTTTTSTSTTSTTVRPTTTTARPATTTTTGVPSGPGNASLLLDSKAGQPIVTAPAMQPGSTVSGTVTISAIPVVNVNLVLGAVTHGGPSGSGNLADKLQLTVTDTTTGRTVYSGALDGLGTRAVCGANSAGNSCQRWAAHEAHNFTFTVTFPSSTPAVDNAYQGTTANVTFAWDATK